MKILITGSTGMLGGTIKLHLEKEGLQIETLDRRDLDLDQCTKLQLTEKIKEKECQVLINCVGLIKQRPGLSAENFISVNGLLPHRLSTVCENLEMKMIHITTDCVFKGDKGQYTENSFHDVDDYYGKSKSIGEPENCTVIRSSIIGEEEKNKLSLLEWVKSNKGGKIKGYENHLWNGVTCLQMSKVILDIIRNKNYWQGVRHVFSNSVSKYDLVKMINEIYELNIEIEGAKTETNVDRTLKSEYGIENFRIPNLYKQIEELKNFHFDIRNERLKNYYDNLI